MSHQAFLTKEKGLYHHRSGRKEIQSDSFRFCTSPRGMRKPGFMYMLWIPQMKAILLKTKAASIPPPHPNWFIVSKCLLVLRKYAIKQEMKKYPFLPEGRVREHIPQTQEISWSGSKPSSGKWLLPSQGKGVVQSLVPIRLQSLLM